MRDEEITELTEMKRACCHVAQDAKLDDEYTKTLILLQGFIAQGEPREATLFSDFNFISQNAGRITRALFEICIQRGWASSALLCFFLSRK